MEKKMKKNVHKTLEGIIKIGSKKSYEEKKMKWIVMATHSAVAMTGHFPGILNIWKININLQCDRDEFCRMLRMPPAVFEEILEEIRPHIARRNTRLCPCVSAEERLSITLKYLATGMYVCPGLFKNY